MGRSRRRMKKTGPSMATGSSTSVPFVSLIIVGTSNTATPASNMGNEILLRR